ncbi:programmed cell death protein 2 isoform X1 [Manihot esculenta]|uniref:Uncharacterized protein n=1 Tax=Manihot esculenta TaxID=3983 RepID=A0ACB7HWV9_MANES|nr:programmed cell death protein 2 isoform X1 [Manihot esculenta]XP_021607467.1 programmed cell death protein 2 isoform X1 [Manihot esculenta]XP_043811404.1 programmed cell death protein 2 isoform X1 [Manihot esculenta]XP_043811405.1 programmed cell death protein 2 isoform X1 [Manihot esculenta]XP_043811406.1 programmed cell death protein 2 isoform X1 [Manihot esculenta]XP_043811407.1 programmed cell death protein 2 isoform X1 [Manihot esculenta]KAG8657287.1 hypothetical protein MANES_03G0586
MDTGLSGDSMEKLKGVRIAPLDDDDDDFEGQENEEVQEPTFEEEEDDDDYDEEEEPVTLGFVEKPKHFWSLLRQLFPSKAGGVPAWLDPVNLPSGRSCACDTCGNPLQFLLQVYAPISEKESTFHRTLFVFMCPKMSCLRRDQHEQWKCRSKNSSRRSVKVFRCQLPHLNPFYSSEAPKLDGTDIPSGSGVALCNWCGTWKGDQFCSSCKKACYCLQQHQAMHRKINCQQLSLSSQLHNSSSSGGETTSMEIIKATSNALWPEYEILNEDESELDAEMSDDNAYDKLLISRKRTDDSMMSLVDCFKGNSDRKCWASFQERIAKAPEQVLRYCRNANARPLWPMSSGRPSKDDIPNCSYCGSPSDFEFQILPQLLYYFGVKNDDVDSLDWATIAVYTCRASCEASIAYKQEFAWVQL